MKFPLSVPSKVKPIEARYMKCKNCHCVAECSIYSAETALKIMGIKVKKVHKHEFAVCPECRTCFYL